jgi:hypothetical protein
MKHLISKINLNKETKTPFYFPFMHFLRNPKHLFSHKFSYFCDQRYDIITR